MEIEDVGLGPFNQSYREETKMGQEPAWRLASRNFRAGREDGYANALSLALDPLSD